MDLQAKRNALARPASTTGRAKKAAQVSISPRKMQRTTLTRLTSRKPSPQPTPSPAKTPKKSPRIPSYAKNNTSKTTMSSPSYSVQSSLDDPELIELRGKVLSGEEITDIYPKKLEKLLDHLREYSASCALQRKYIDAKEADKAAVAIRHFLNSMGPIYIDTAEQEEQYIDEKTKFLNQLRDEINEYDEQTEAKKKSLIVKQQEELEKFENKWRTEMPDKYRKPSGKLLNIMSQEKRLALAGAYDDAEVYAREADKLLKVEMENAQRNLIRDYKIAKSKFMESQKNELELFNNTRKHWREVMLSRHEVEKAKFNKRAEVLVLKSNEATYYRESMLDPENRNVKENAAVSRIRQEIRNENNELLPPLIAPNDESIIQSESLQSEKRTQKNKEIEKHLRSKTPTSRFYIPHSLSETSSPSSRQDSKINSEENQKILNDESQTTPRGEYTSSNFNSTPEKNQRISTIINEKLELPKDENVSIE